MRICVIGAGRIGGNAARRWVAAGHDVVLTFTRDAEALWARAEDLGAVAEPDVAAAAADADVVLLAVPWSTLDAVLEQAGGLDGRTVIDTTNPYGATGLVDLAGRTAAVVNAERLPGASYAKALNTLTAAFQAGMAERSPDERAAMFYAAADEPAAEHTDVLVSDLGFVPVRVAWAAVELLEAPRRPGSVYGEEYRPDDARRIAALVADDPQQAARLAAELARSD